MSKRYTLTLTKTQVQQLASASELFVRLGLGQLEYVFDTLRDLHPGAQEDFSAEQALKWQLLRMAPHSSHGICHPDVADSVKSIHDIRDVLMRQLASEDQGPAGRMNVWLREPLHLGSEPLAEIKPE